jgi:hypothetical protein
LRQVTFERADLILQVRNIIGTDPSATLGLDRFPRVVVRGHKVESFDHFT